MMNAISSFHEDQDGRDPVAVPSDDALSRTMGLRLAIVVGLVVIFCAIGAVLSMVLVAGIAPRAAVYAAFGVIVFGLAGVAFAYQFASHLGKRIQTLTDSLEAVASSFTKGSTDTITDMPEADGHVRLYARLEWIEARVDMFARAARSMSREREESRDLLTEQGAAKTKFFAKMSHELRTPLNAILGYSTLLHEDANDRADAAGKADLERIQLAGRKLLSLIDDLLELSGMQKGRVDKEHVVFELGDFVEEVVERYSSFNPDGSRIVVENKLGGQIVLGDRTKIARCLRNLLDSALDNSTDGTVTLEIADCVDLVQISVRDNGPAISPELAKALFDTASSEVAAAGQGGRSSVALTVARDLAQSLGGDCTVEPGITDGAVMNLSFPANNEPMEGVPVNSFVPYSDEEIRDGGQRYDTALIIDDDPAAIDLLSRWLQRWDYKVLSAENGFDGLALAREHHPDLVLLDALMPGKSGYDVLAEIRNDPDMADVPVVLVTVDDDRMRGINAGASDFIRKPISEDQLRKVVTTYSNKIDGDILIIDDDDDASNIMQRNLQRLGFKARCAIDGEQGLELAQESLPCAIVLDLAMPRIDGFAFLEQLGRNPQLCDIPVIVVSGYDLSLSQHHLLTKANAKYFRKGSSAPREIAETLRELVA